MVISSKNPAEKNNKKNNLISVDKSIDRIASVEPSLNKVIDKIASVEQKEIAMAEAGVTRVKTYKVINNLLTATKTVEILKDGEIIKTEVPDVQANAKGAELALKAFNDLKEFERTAGVTHNKVVYQWLNVSNNISPSRILSDE